MKRKKLFENSIRFVQKSRLWRPQWRRRMALAVALFLPGMPHIFGKKHFYSGCCLCLFGVGALLALSISIIISSSMIQTFDAIYSISISNFEMLYLYIPNKSDLYHQKDYTEFHCFYYNYLCQNSYTSNQHKL